MTKTEAIRAFMAKDIQIYVDCPNFSLLNEIVYGKKDHFKFTESDHMNMYILKKGTSFEYSKGKFVNPNGAKIGEFYPIVKLSEIEEEVTETADVEVKHLTMRVSLEGVALCVEKDTKGFSTLELIAACVLMKEALDNEQAELTAGRDRPE